MYVHFFYKSRAWTLKCSSRYVLFLIITMTPCIFHLLVRVTSIGNSLDFISLWYKIKHYSIKDYILILIWGMLICAMFQLFTIHPYTMQKEYHPEYPHLRKYQGYISQFFHNSTHFLALVFVLSTKTLHSHIYFNETKYLSFNHPAII